MEKAVKIDKTSILITIFVMLLIVGCMIGALLADVLVGAYILAAVLVGISVAGFFLTPLKVSADPERLTIHFYLRNRTFELADIASAEPWQIGSDCIRVCGSGGWFGYWGWFSSRRLGKFFAWFGNPSECFLIRLRDGRKYVVGCVDAAQMAAYIAANLK